MKILPLILILISLFFLSAVVQAQEKNYSPGDQQHPQEVSQPDTLTFTVYGMDCPGCAGGLEKQVNKISSVEESQANWVKQELKVVLKKDSVLDLKELKNRVEKANFTLKTDSDKD